MENADHDVCSIHELLVYYALGIAAAKERDAIGLPSKGL
jgi:hypothetical protein